MLTLGTVHTPLEISPVGQPMADAEDVRTQNPTGDAEPPYPSRTYAWFVVIVLMLIYVNSFLDRQILGLLVDPIRDSLDISESQMGFLMGPAFAIFYIIAGIPMGRLADVMSRRWLVFIGQFFWSLMSVGCGMVGTYTPFLAFRVGVGVGEATLSPSAYSMITDLFPKRRLAFALSVYGMGIYLGSGLARFFGGYAIEFAEAFDSLQIPWVGREIYSWQIVFFLIAAPTVPLSLLLLAIREPARRGVRQTKTALGHTVEASVPYSEVLAYLWQNRRTMLTYSFGFALLAFSGYGAAAWFPSHLIRNFGWTPKEVGVAVGTAAVTAGPIGILCGGWLSDTFRRRGVAHARLLVALISAAGWIPFGIAYPLVGSGTLAVWMYAPAIGIGAMTAGVGPAGIQEIMPNKMRGQASAIYLFIINLMGLGFGPFIIALFTQYVFGSDADVRLSLLTVPVAAHAIAAILLLASIRPYLRSLTRLKEWHAQRD